MNKQIQGTLMTIVAGVAWGLSGVSGQYLMEQGISVDLLTTLRLLISGVFLVGLSLATARKQFRMILFDKYAWRDIVLFAVFGLVLNQIAYLTAIQYTNAGTATVLQYLCPVLVLAYTCLRKGQLPTIGEVTAISFALCGTFLIATHGQLTSFAVTPLGLAWGLLAAITYVLYLMIPIHVVQCYGSLPVMGLGMLLGGITLAVLRQVWQESLPLTVDILWGLVGIVGLGTIFAYTIFLKGVSLIGPVNGSLLASIEPIAAVCFAVLLLNEQFFAIDLVGMFFILLAVVLISVKDLLVQKKMSRNNQRENGC